MSELPLVLTVEEAAKALRISRGSAYEAVRTGDLPHVRVGRTIRVPRKALLALLGDEDEAPARRADSASDAARAPGTSASASSPVGAHHE